MIGMDGFAMIMITIKSLVGKSTRLDFAINRRKKKYLETFNTSRESFLVVFAWWDSRCRLVFSLCGN